MMQPSYQRDMEKIGLVRMRKSGMCGIYPYRRGKIPACSMISYRMDGYFETGKFRLGTNYWASHAGTAMWSDWRPDSVAADLKALARSGVEVLRVFPLWPDFQPLKLLYGGHGRPAEYRFGETPLSDDPDGRAGVDPEMIRRFAEFESLAGRNGLKLMVGLITGWMSGRLFVPPAFAGRNPLTDPAAMLWQQRFVRYFVEKFREADSIIAWDLGNEVNCMGPASREQAWLWAAGITNAIRAADPTRPVVSGMHGLSPHGRDSWRIQDQAEITDLLTTHPYPPFTPHCDLDPIPTMRPCLHATAESLLYGDVGGRPCLAEEFGTLGPGYADAGNAAAYVRTNLFSLWAHDCRALLWWCAFDQDHLEHAPYDWSNVERELGMLHKDRKPKPLANEFVKFSSFFGRLPFDRLPPRHIDGVCLLSPDQDCWGAAYSAFILAKQAGVDIAFRYSDQPLGEPAVILVPSLQGQNHLNRRRWLELRERVAAGASLYISVDNAIISGFKDLTGLEVISRQRRGSPLTFDFDGSKFSAGPDFLSRLRLSGAEALGSEPDGNPAFSVFKLGKGRVFFLSFPLEMELAERPGIFDAGKAVPFWRIYARIFSGSAGRILQRDLPVVGVTEHALDPDRRMAVLINHSPQEAKTILKLAGGWGISETLYGDPPASRGDKFEALLRPNDALILILKSGN